MKNTSLIILSFLFIWTLEAQPTQYRWRLGAYGGLATAYGDLNQRIVPNNSKLENIGEHLDHIAYGLGLEYRLSPAWTMRLQASKLQTVANDRYQAFDGTMDNNADYFRRALNAQTDIWDATFGFSYYTNNGKLLSQKAFLAPYFHLGIGLSKFDVYADLLNANGGRYHYWSDNSIRDIAENAPNAAQAVVINQDLDFETKLNGLKTEAKSYNNWTGHLALGLGLQFRLSSRVFLNLETVLKYTNSDYLDDVSNDYPVVYDNSFQQYASNPSNWAAARRGTNPSVKDAYAFTSLSLHYSFGWMPHSFRAPIIYTNPAPLDLFENLKAANKTKADSTALAEVNSDSSIVPETDSLKMLVKTNKEVQWKFTVKSDSIVVKSAQSDSSGKIMDLPVKAPAFKDKTTQQDLWLLQMQLMQRDMETLNRQLLEYKLKGELEKEAIKNELSIEMLKNMLENERALNELRMQMLQKGIQPTTTTKPVDLGQIAPKKDTASGVVKTKTQKDTVQVQEKELVKKIDTVIVVQAPKPRLDSVQRNKVADMDKKMDNLEKVLEARQKDTSLVAAKATHQAMETELNNLEALVTELKKRAVVVVDTSKAITPQEKRQAQKEQEAALKEAERIGRLEEKMANLKKELAQERRENWDLKNRPDADKPVTFGRGEQGAKMRKEIEAIRADLKALEELKTSDKSDTIIRIVERVDTITKVRVDTIVRVVEKTNMVNQSVADSLQNALLEMKARNDAVKEEQKRIKMQGGNTVEIDKSKADQLSALELENARLRKQVEEMRQSLNMMGDYTNKMRNDNEKNYAATRAGKKQFYKNNLYFEVNSSNLSLQAQETLLAVIDNVEANPDIHIHLVGYASKVGNSNTNLEISKQRALTAKAFINKHSKIGSDRIFVEYVGDQHSEMDELKSRKVEIELFVKE